MLGVYNIEFPLKFELQKHYNIFNEWGVDFPKIDALYIEWIKKSNSKSYSLQATIVYRYIKKKIPIVIFDRYLLMTRKEFEWLRKFNNVFLFEPALHNRYGFRYLPRPINVLKYEDLGKNKKYEWDLGYIGNLANKTYSFKKYYKSFAENNIGSKICYSTILNNDTVEKYRYSNLKRVDNVDWYDIRCAVAIDTYKNYAIGYLNEWIFEAMKKGCLVLLPIEHKYFGNMFNRLVVSNIEDIGILTINLEANINQIIIEEIFENIKNLYPEFTMNYTVEVIKECIK